MKIVPKALVRRAANLDAENEPGYGSPSTKCENMTEIMSHKVSSASVHKVRIYFK